MTHEQAILESNKDLVRRYNREILQEGNAASAEAILSPVFVNRTAPPGTPAGRDGLLHTFDQVLRPAFPDLEVVIHDQIAEDDRVTTRKTIHGTHRGELLGVPPTNRRVAIEVIDILRIEAGRVVEHWGLNTLPQVLATLARH